MANNDGSDITEQKQEVAGVFGRAASTYDRVGPRFFSHFGRRLVEIVHIPRGAKVLDVATGKGAVLFPAAEMVGPQGRVIGIDLSRDMVRENQKEIERLNLRNVEVHKMDAEHLNFSDESFDYVLCSFAIFFFPQLERALSEMYRILKPNGHIVISSWGPKDERWKWLDDLFKAYLPSDESETRQAQDPQPAPKYVFYTPEGLDAILASAGFVEIQIISESKEFTYVDKAEWWSTQWSHGRRAGLEEIQEKLGEDRLRRFQLDAFGNLKAIQHPDGIHELFSVLYGFAIKPSG